jgi:hypothetical protein
VRSQSERVVELVHHAMPARPSVISGESRMRAWRLDISTAAKLFPGRGETRRRRLARDPSTGDRLESVR